MVYPKWQLENTLIYLVTIGRDHKSNGLFKGVQEGFTPFFNRLSLWSFGAFHYFLFHL